METLSLNQADTDAERTPRYIVVLKVGGNELDDESFLFGLAQAVKATLDHGHFPVVENGLY